jgi:hypothetical protein
VYITAEVELVVAVEFKVKVEVLVEVAVEVTTTGHLRLLRLREGAPLSMVDFVTSYGHKHRK